MSLAPGSGVWYQLGRTIAFSDRAAACAHFKLPQHVCKGWGIPLGRVFPEGRFELAALLGLRHAARAAGYDSVQYVSAPGFNYEIQDLRDGEGSEACARDFAARPRAPPHRRAVAEQQKRLQADFFAPVCWRRPSNLPHWGGARSSSGVVLAVAVVWRHAARRAVRLTSRRTARACVAGAQGEPIVPPVPTRALQGGLGGRPPVRLRRDARRAQLPRHGVRGRSGARDGRSWWGGLTGTTVRHSPSVRSK